MRQVGHLNELHEKYFDKGLRIIAISNEPMGTIKSKMADAKYWIGSDPSGSMLTRLGGGGIPHAYLIDATGTVVTSMHPGNLQEQQIEELLGQAFNEALGRELAPSLRGAVKYWEKGDYGKAWAAAGKYVEDEDRAVAADAAYLREKAEAYAAFKKKLVETGIQRRDYATVLDDLEAIAKDFGGLEAASWAAAKKKELEADDAVKEELKAWKAYEKAYEKELRAEGKEKKLGPARTAYERILKKHAGTRAAELAQAALQRIGG